MRPYSHKYRINRKRRHRAPPGRAVRHDLQVAGSTANRPDRRQRRLPEPGARDAEDAGEHRRDLGKTSEEIVGECLVLSALESTDLALENGLTRASHHLLQGFEAAGLIAVYRELAATRTSAPLGLTEAGMGTKGLVWSAARWASFSRRGLAHDRVSLTPAPAATAARRSGRPANSSSPSASVLRSLRTACPGCAGPPRRLPGAGRADPGLSESGCRSGGEARRRRDDDPRRHGVHRERAGESKAANIGISLPGTGEAPSCPSTSTARSSRPEGNARRAVGSLPGSRRDYVTTKYREGTPGRPDASAAPEAAGGGEALPVPVAALVLGRLEIFGTVSKAGSVIRFAKPLSRSRRARSARAVDRQPRPFFESFAWTTGSGRGRWSGRLPPASPPAVLVTTSYPA